MIYLDTVGIKFLANELNDNLENCKINKIVGYDENSFSIFFGKKNLYFDNKHNAVVFLSDEKMRNTEFNSSFLLKLKKYITGAYVRKIYNHPNDRIIIFNIEKLNVVGYVEEYKLIYELLGKQVNVVLVDNNNTILANMYYYFNAERKNLTNSNYVFPKAISKYGKYMKILNEEKQKQFESSYTPVLYQNNLFTYNKFLDLNYIEFSSLNEGLNEYFKKYTNLSLIENKKNPIYKFIDKNIERLEKILKKIPKDIKENSDYEKYKIMGDVLVSNLYKIKKSDEKISLFNYYTNSEIEISLDKNLSPSKNVEKFYQKYAKCKRREESLIQREMDIRKELEYFEEQKHYLDNENDILGIEEIEKELGVKKQSRIKSTRQSKRDLYTVQYKDALIYIGRNSSENDKITFEIAKPKDLWFHIKDVPGSHVVVKCDNITEDIIYFASKLAVENSKNKTYGTVDYCQRKNVKKIHGAGKGQVTYKEYKSIEIK